MATDRGIPPRRAAFSYIPAKCYRANGGALIASGALKRRWFALNALILHDNTQSLAPVLRPFWPGSTAACPRLARLARFVQQFCRSVQPGPKNQRLAQ